jgi:hypothetical protein
MLASGAGGERSDMETSSEYGEPILEGYTADPCRPELGPGARKAAAESVAVKSPLYAAMCGQADAQAAASTRAK